MARLAVERGRRVSGPCAAATRAWVEASLDGGAWTRFDATPAAVLTEDPYDGIGGFFARLRDAIDFAWNRDVLAYDPTTQRRTLRAVAESVAAGAKGMLSRLGAWAVVPVLLLAAWLVRFRRRARARATEGDPTASRVAFYAATLRALRRRGVARRGSEAPLAFSARASGALDPGATRALSDATAAFLRVRYGGRAGAVRGGERRLDRRRPGPRRRAEGWTGRRVGPTLTHSTPESRTESMAPNNRIVKKANHGRRPCNRRARMKKAIKTPR